MQLPQGVLWNSKEIKQKFCDKLCSGKFKFSAAVAIREGCVKSNMITEFAIALNILQAENICLL